MNGQLPLPEPTPAPTPPPGSSGILSQDGLSPPGVRPSHSFNEVMKQIAPPKGGPL